MSCYVNVLPLLNHLAIKMAVNNPNSLHPCNDIVSRYALFAVKNQLLAILLVKPQQHNNHSWPQRLPKSERQSNEMTAKIAVDAFRRTVRN